jgi:hypothetical protein
MPQIQDTSVDTVDEALGQLRRLREGPGLTADRLRAAGALMSALGTSDAVVGQERLRLALIELGEAARFTVLRVDLALDLTEATLGRPPLADDYAFLTSRRAALAKRLNRDVKTLSRWSDRACAELRAQLIDDTFRGDVYVTGLLRDGQLVATTLTRDDGTSRDTIDGPEVTHREGPPLLVFGLPRDWRPSSLGMALVVHTGPLPFTVELIVAGDFLSLSAGGVRYPVQVRDGAAFARVQQPRLDQLYALWWR